MHALALGTPVSTQATHAINTYHDCMFGPFCMPGMRQADINIAEGKKKARILTSEAYMAEQMNRATGDANAVLAKAEAQAEAIKRVADALQAEVSDSNVKAVSVGFHSIVEQPHSLLSQQVLYM